MYLLACPPAELRSSRDGAPVADFDGAHRLAHASLGVPGASSAGGDAQSEAVRGRRLQ
jgi:hypothetical protein